MKNDLLNFLAKYYQKETKSRFWISVLLKVLVFLGIILILKFN